MHAEKASAPGREQAATPERPTRPAAQRQPGESGLAGAHGADLAAQIRRAGGGLPLAPPLRSRLEAALDADLGAVRLHTDSAADAMARALSARAFTSGQNIFFRGGAFEPDTTPGLRLLAHEAAHTVQQARGPVDGVPGPGGVALSLPDDRFELAARSAEEHVLGAPAPVAGPAAAAPAHAPAPAGGAPSVQRNGDGPQDPNAVAPVVITARNLDEAAAGAAPLILERSRERMRIIVANGRAVRVYSGSGQPLTARFAFREPHPLPPGLFFLQADENNPGQNYYHRVYSRRDGTPVTDPEAAEVAPRTGEAGGGVFRVEDQLNDQDRAVYVRALQGHPNILVIPEAPAATGGGAEGGGAEGAQGEGGEGAEGAPRRARPRPADPESQFSGGGLTANLPAFPAQLSGPEMQPAGGMGSYRMQLNFNAYDPTLLGGVAEAMRYVDYRWELIPLPDEVIQRARQTAEQDLQQSQPGARVSDEATRDQLRRATHRRRDAGGSRVTRSESSEFQHGEIARERAEDLATVEQNSAVVRRLLQAEIEVSSGWRRLMAYASDLGSFLGEERSERDIPWPRRHGWYIVRCIAQPESSGEYRRAASVQTMLVEVRSPRRLAEEALDQPGAELEQRNLEIRALTFQRDGLAADDPRRQQLDERIASLVRRRDRAVLRNSGDIATMLEAELADARAVRRHLLRLGEEGLSEEQILEAQRQLAELGAYTRNVGAIITSGEGALRIVRHERWDVDSRIARLEEQLELIRDRGDQMRGQRIRPQAVFVSRVTGQTFPLLLHLAPAADAEGAAFAYVVSDVTTPDGRIGRGRGATEATAATAAMDDFAHQNEYGHGLLVVRMPPGAPFQLTRPEFTNTPGDEAIARGRIGDVIAAVAAIGLIATGVGAAATAGGTALAGGAVAAETATGGAAALLTAGSILSSTSSALGTAAGIAGAIQAGDSLILRWRESRLRLDAGALNDLINLLAGFTSLGSMVGNRVRAVTSSRFFTLVDTAAGTERIMAAEQAMMRAVSFVDAMRRVENLVGDIGFVYGNLLTLEQIIAINDAVARGDMTHAQAAGQRASIIAGAIPGAIQFAHGLLERAGAPESVGPDYAQRRRRPTSGAPEEIAPPAAERPPEPAGERTMAGTPRGGPQPPAAPADAARAARLATHERFVAAARARLGESRPTPRSGEPELPRNHPPARGLSVDNAYQVYEQTVARAGDREVGLWFNPNTGEYAVTVGTQHSVSAPPGDGWQGTLHLHPNPDNILTYRNPAPHDVWNTLRAAFSNGRPTTEFVEATLPDGSRRTTAVTVDPADGSITLEFQRPGRPSERRSFASLDAYVQEYGAPTRGLDPASPEYRWIIHDIDQYFAARRRDAAERTAAGSVPPAGEAAVTPAPPGEHPAPAPRRETGPQTPEAQHAAAELLYALQQPAPRPQPGELTPVQAAGRELIRNVGDWKAGLRRVLEAVPHPQERAAATRALVEARQAIVDAIYQRVVARFPDVYMFNSGTVAFNSDIDITIRPIEQRADFAGQPRERATQIRDAGEAAAFFAEQLRATVGGETDRVLDTNVYAYIGEGSFGPELRTPRAREAQAEALGVAGMAAQRRAQGRQAWESFRASMEARLAADQTPQGREAAARLRAQMDAAEAYAARREQEHSAAVELARRQHPDAPAEAHERMAREAIVGARTRELAEAAAGSPPDIARIVDLQSQILWFQPDAYVTRSAIDQAVTHQQGRRAAGTASAAAAAGDAPTQRRRARLEQSLTEARRALAELETRSPPAEPAALAAARERAEALRQEFRAEVNADLAASGAQERARDFSTGQQLAHSAAASAENLGMMHEHVRSAGDDLAAQIKAACKYGGRILLAERLAGLGSSSPEAAALIALFTRSRWSLFEGTDVPQRLITRMLAQYALARGMFGQLRRDDAGHVVGVSDAVRRAFVDGMLGWAGGATERLQVVAATAPRQAAEPAPTPQTPAAPHEPVAPPPPDLGDVPQAAPAAPPVPAADATPAPQEAAPGPAAHPGPAPATPSILRGGGTPRYADSQGNVTADGAAFLRSRFARATVTRDRATGEMDDAALSHELAQNWRWLEALQRAELERQWQRPGGAVVADLRRRAESPQFAFASTTTTLRQMLRYINRAAAIHAPERAGSDTVLATRTWDFLQARLAANDPLVTALVAEIRSRFPRDWRNFERTGTMPLFGDGFGALGDKMPDVVEVDLAAGRVAVIDITQAYADPRHNLKTALYMRALEAMFPGMTVTGREYRRPGQVRDF